jgi:FtsZ-interacting cell division protein ZipA
MNIEFGSLFLLLYVGTILAIVILVVSALWRSMKAQEATAISMERISHSLEQIEKIIARRVEQW